MICRQIKMGGFPQSRKNDCLLRQRLNKSRQEKLERVWTLASNPLIEWNSVGQNGAIELKTAKQLFHGFVIYYRPKPTKESIEEELSMIDEYLKSSDSIGDTGNTISTATSIEVPVLTEIVKVDSLGLDAIAEPQYSRHKRKLTRRFEMEEPLTESIISEDRSSVMITSTSETIPLPPSGSPSGEAGGSRLKSVSAAVCSSPETLPSPFPGCRYLSVRHW